MGAQRPYQTLKIVSVAPRAEPGNSHGCHTISGFERGAEVSSLQPARREPGKEGVARTGGVDHAFGRGGTRHALSPARGGNGPGLTPLEHDHREMREKNFNLLFG